MVLGLISDQVVIISTRLDLILMFLLLFSSVIVFLLLLFLLLLLLLLFLFDRAFLLGTVLFRDLVLLYTIERFHLNVLEAQFLPCWCCDLTFIGLLVADKVFTHVLWLVLQPDQILVVHFLYQPGTVFQVHVEVVVDELKLLLPGLVAVLIQVVLKCSHDLSGTELENKLLNANELHANEVPPLRHERVYLLVPDVGDHLVIMRGDLMADQEALKVLDYLSKT